MRIRSFLGALLVCSLTQAQNWALLNPEYRYNYSDDGTDTISNQIRVMHIDTLGVDSFRYELNLIGVVCDTCPASLGGPCNGCFVRVNQPQFLGYECLRSGNEWLFNGADTFLLRSNAGLGASWQFDATEAITATVDAEWPAELFGISDTLQRILLSDGDSILLSRSLGIVRFDRGDEQYDLIGVEGLGVGQLFPDPLAYFDYQPGDELTYKVTSMYWAIDDGGPQIRLHQFHHWKALITGRSSAPDGVVYSTSVARTYASPGSWDSFTFSFGPNWPMPTNQWLFTRSDIIEDHPILVAYPGQVLDTSICWFGSQWSGWDAAYIAEQRLTANGICIMRSKDLGQADGQATSGFSSEDSSGADAYPFLQDRPIYARYQEGLGVLTVVHAGQWANYRLAVELVGAILDGDTVIPPPPINWTVGVEEDPLADWNIAPNPASESVTIQGVQAGQRIAIHTLQGRLVLTHKISSPTEFIDVHDLAPGIYMVTIEGLFPQRLMIAR